MAHPQSSKGAGGLLQQLGPVHQHGDPLAPLGCLLGDMAKNHCLAAASGQHKQHGPVAGQEGSA